MFSIEQRIAGWAETDQIPGLVLGSTFSSVGAGQGGASACCVSTLLANDACQLRVFRRDISFYVRQLGGLGYDFEFGLCAPEWDSRLPIYV